jgi:hypothetical protein
LEVFKPGLRELVFSEVDGGWSGTGIAPEMQEDRLSTTTIIIIDSPNDSTGKWKLGATETE